VARYWIGAVVWSTLQGWLTLPHCGGQSGA
jgi:hypothetical protein